MATIWIPSLLRSLVDGESQVVAPGRTVGDVIDALEIAYPGLGVRLCPNDQLAPSIQVLVDGRAALLVGHLVRRPPFLDLGLSSPNWTLGIGTRAA